jgi:hypothetical protein
MTLLIRDKDQISGPGQCVEHDISKHVAEALDDHGRATSNWSLKDWLLTHQTNRWNEGRAGLKVGHMGEGSSRNIHLKRVDCRHIARQGIVGFNGGEFLTARDVWVEHVGRGGLILQDWSHVHLENPHVGYTGDNALALLGAGSHNSILNPQIWYPSDHTTNAGAIGINTSHTAVIGGMVRRCQNAAVGVKAHRNLPEGEETPPDMVRVTGLIVDGLVDADSAQGCFFFAETGQVNVNNVTARYVDGDGKRGDFILGNFPIESSVHQFDRCEATCRFFGRWNSPPRKQVIRDCSADTSNDAFYLSGKSDFKTELVIEGGQWVNTGNGLDPFVKLIGRDKHTKLDRLVIRGVRAHGYDPNDLVWVGGNNGKAELGEIVIEDCKMDDQPITGVRTNESGTVHSFKGEAAG